MDKRHLNTSHFSGHLMIVSVPKTLTAIKALCSPTLCVDSKAFSSKDVLIKIDPLESATQAVTDIVVLSSSKKDQVPSGYSRLL